MSSDNPQTFDRGNAVPFAAFVPHPPILLPEIGGSESSRVQTTFDACEGIARTLAEQKVGTIVMTSPHMAHVDRVPGVFGGNTFTGDLAQFRAPELRFSFENDTDLANLIKRMADDGDVPLREIPPNQALNLDHGLTVFLYFLNRLDYRPKLCLITPAYSAYEDNFQYGGLLAAAMVEHHSSCAFVASGDLSHRLTHGAPAGYNPRGREFDDAYCNAMRGRDYESLLKLDRGLIDAAGVCGHVTMLMLLGSSLSLGLESNFVSYEGPWGVGYLVSRFEAVDVS